MKDHKHTVTIIDERRQVVDMLEYLVAETSDYVMKENIDPITIKSIHKILAEVLAMLQKD